MILFAHHEALLISQATARFTVAGSATTLSPSSVKLPNRMDRLHRAVRRELRVRSRTTQTERRCRAHWRRAKPERTMEL